MPEAVIVAATRSPIGRALKGSLAELRPDDLAAQLVEAVLGQVPGLPRDQLDDLILGCGRPGGEQGFNLGRVVATLVGLDTVPATTVTRYCASSLQSIRMALHAIRAREGHAFVAAGVECVSRAHLGTSDNPPLEPGADTRDRVSNPWINPRFAASQARTRERSGAGTAVWTDPRAGAELPDIYVAMGQTAENVAQACAVTRADQDEFAAMSQQRAERALENGFWAEEITPVQRPDGTTAEVDDCPRRGVTVDTLATLKPVFRPDGTVTAGNCCPLNDGAAAVVVMSDVRAAELGIRPLARIVATGVSAVSPEVMGLGPVESSRRALTHAGMSMRDVDLVEINEAFAAQVLASARQLEIDPDRLNMQGGAIALGHPFGMTGARIATTLLHSLRARDKQIGLATMCAGGGQGMAMLVERLA